jgi:RNA polymerase sigma-70 factor (ECF subfamily)
MPECLLHDVAAGKADSIDACLRRFSAPVWQLARRVLGSEHDTEDAVQEIFLDVWRSAERFDPRAGSELTFVLTIARRRLIDRTRRRQRIPAPDEAAVETVTELGSAMAGVETRDESARVAAAMAQLRPEQRSVLEASFLAGQTHSQIAAETGMALGTVKTHARRGLRRVRELLGIDPDVNTDRPRP